MKTCQCCSEPNPSDARTCITCGEASFSQLESEEDETEKDEDDENEDDENEDDEEDDDESEDDEAEDEATPAPTVVKAKPRKPPPRVARARR